MITTETRSQSIIPPSETVEERYRRLAAEWNTATQYLSDPAKIMAHPAMQAIVEMGDKVVPYILRDLKSQPSLIVWSLPLIARVNLVPPKTECGFLKIDVGAQVEAWLQWGREKGLV